MPWLMGIRFESVGHRDARLGGLSLPLVGHGGRPADSVLWLRNGGGKSSILNLVFSVMRPNQREFLGSEADAGVRELRHYLAPDDTGTVCLAWELHGDGDGPRPQLLTGVTMEYGRGGSGEGRDLRRLFFALRIEAPADGSRPLDELPLVVDEGGQRRVLRLAALREALVELDKRPGYDLAVTETQRAWRELLASYQLDPEVFGYQLKMNRSEGIADEIFRFGSSEEFADFVLEMVLPTDQADQVSANLRELRARVAERPRLLQERDGLSEAARALGPIVTLAGERDEAHLRLGQAVEALLEAARVVRTAAEDRERRAAEAEQQWQREDKRYRESSSERVGANWAQTVFRDLRQGLICQRLERAAEAAQVEVARLEREAALLRVAEDLSESRRGQREAELMREELQARLSEARPLLDELHQAAAWLRDALGAEIDILDTRAELLERRQKEHARELGSLQGRLRDQAVTIGRAAERIEGLRKTLERLDGRRQELEQRGALQSGEAVEEAVERLTGRIDAHEERRERLETRAIELERAAALAREAARQARERAADAHHQAEVVRGALENARGQLERLAGSPPLQRALEDAAPDLLRLGSDALARLATRLGALSDEVLSLRLAEEQDYRGLEWLERHGLLPPSIDAEAVQEALVDRGLRAFTGGAYLAENRRGKAADARVRARPELVAGVVVDEADLDRSAAALEAASPEVSSPVAVGTTADLLDGGERRLVVMPPRSLYSRRAAREEGAQRRARAVKRRETLQSLTAEKTELEAVRGELHSALEQRPARWFEDQRALMERHRGDAEAAASEADDHHRREAEAVDELRQVRDLLRQLEVEARGHERTLAEVEAFGREGGDEIPALESERVLLQRDQQEARQEQRRLEGELSRLQQTIEGLHRQARQMAADREPLQRERATVQSDCVDEEGGPGRRLAVVEELGPARQLYQSRKRAYEERTGAEALQGRIEAMEVHVEAVERRLELRLSQAGARRDEVAEALEQAESSLGLVETQTRVDGAVERARAAAGEARGELLLARSVAEQTEAEVTRLIEQHRAKMVEELRQRAAGWDVERLSAEVDEAQQRANRAREEESDAQSRRDEARKVGERARSDLQRLADWSSRIDDARSHLPELSQVRRALAGESLDAPDESEVPDLEVLERAVDEAVREVNGATARAREIEERAGRAARMLESFALDPANEVLPPSIRQRLREPELDQLLPRAATLLEDVRVRGDNIATELAEVEKHRALIAIGLEQATDRALDVLRELEPASVFAPEVASWGGHAFIKVRLKVPPTASERSAVAATLIDRLVQQQDIPSGLKLIQRMVRELSRGGGLSIRILKPEVRRRLDYPPVQGLRAFSGGERLTSAILLYCTLARMRAQRRGSTRAPTGVLVLDNPVGACSHPEFLELQREMARSHRVQLVYTTGVEDLEALTRLPNVLRLRNSHADVRGRRRVTLDEAAGATMTAARIARAERRP